jgi:ubiquinone/menaquinone biosynthesis C-methylase UbiE
MGGDISLPMLEAARRLNENRRDLSLVRLEAEALPFSDKAFDVVFCARLFHHLPNRRHRERILAESFRVARRKVVFTYKARFTYEHLKTSLKVLLRGRWSECRRFFLSESEILDIAEACDWSLERRYSVRGRWSANRVVTLRPRCPGTTEQGD